MPSNVTERPREIRERSALLERLGKRPLLELDMRLGEASGALAAVPLLRLAAAAVTEVATFGDWGLQR